MSALCVPTPAQICTMRVFVVVFAGTVSAASRSVAQTIFSLKEHCFNFSWEIRSMSKTAADVLSWSRNKASNCGFPLHRHPCKEQHGVCHQRFRMDKFEEGHAFDGSPSPAGKHSASDMLLMPDPTLYTLTRSRRTHYRVDL